MKIVSVTLYRIVSCHTLYTVMVSQVEDICNVNIINNLPVRQHGFGVKLCECRHHTSDIAGSVEKRAHFQKSS